MQCLLRLQVYQHTFSTSNVNEPASVPPAPASVPNMLKAGGTTGVLRKNTDVGKTQGTSPSVTNVVNTVVVGNKSQKVANVGQTNQTITYHTGTPLATIMTQQETTDLQAT